MERILPPEAYEYLQSLKDLDLPVEVTEEDLRLVTQYSPDGQRLGQNGEADAKMTKCEPEGTNQGCTSWLAPPREGDGGFRKSWWVGGWVALSGGLGMVYALLWTNGCGAEVHSRRFPMKLLDCRRYVTDSDDAGAPRNWQRPSFQELAVGGRPTPPPPPLMGRLQVVQ